jgi:CubicO group peptidase (beta-lactamase class C family)
MTKLITATCLLQLVERGLVTLSEDLRPRVPQLAALQILKGFNDNDEPILEDNTKPITLRYVCLSSGLQDILTDVRSCSHLLTHTSGLLYDLQDADLLKWSAFVNRTDNAMTWSLEGFTTPLKFAPGEGWAYGTSLDWAGFFLETITEQTLAEYMKENIFEPLDMKSTAFNVSSIPNIQDRLADWPKPSSCDESLLVPGTPPYPDEFTFYSGGAGLFSTTSDYSKFLTALLQGRLLKDSTRDLMFTPQLTETEHNALADATAGELWNFYVPEIDPRNAPIDHGLSGVINLEDSPGKRRKGSMMWSGMTNPRWWIDRETGIAAVMTTQVEPFNHPLAIQLWRDLEKAIYENFTDVESGN